MSRKLVYYGHPVLRQKSVPIEVINQEIHTLIDDMIQVMNFHRGIGLAACQVGASVRLFICNVNELDEEGLPVSGALKVYINPVIEVIDDTEWIDSEGCLSVPKIYEDVPRPTKIRIQALDEKGKPFSEELEGWRARPILHENDHLNGVLFFDRIAPHRKQAIQPQLRKIKKQYSSDL